MTRFFHPLLAAACVAAAALAPVDAALAEHRGGDGDYRHGHEMRSLPPGHRVYRHGDDRFYFSYGLWYAPRGPYYVAVAPPVGLQVDMLPWGYRTVVVAGLTYFVLNDVWYQSAGPGYVVVAPPADAPPVAAAPVVPSANGSDLYIYPSKGQSEEQQARDRYECHAWAVGQTGFDPTRPLGGVGADAALQKRADYQRAMTACLTGRGYTVN